MTPVIQYLLGFSFGLLGTLSSALAMSLQVRTTSHTGSQEFSLSAIAVAVCRSSPR